MTLGAKINPLDTTPSGARTVLPVISLQPKAAPRKAPTYALSSKAEHISRAFSHGVLTGCTDEPGCYPTCYLAAFCPCYVVARLQAKEGFTPEESCPGGSYGPACRLGFFAYSIVQLGMLASLFLVIVKYGYGLANPPPPPPSPVDPWYYLHYPAYLVPLGQFFVVWMLTRLRQAYRVKHTIRALPHGAAETHTDEDDLCQTGLCYCCAGCDNLCCAAWCGCCVLIQLVDDHNLVASEVSGAERCRAASGRVAARHAPLSPAPAPSSFLVYPFLTCRLLCLDAGGDPRHIRSRSSTGAPASRAAIAQRRAATTAGILC